MNTLEQPIAELKADIECRVAPYEDVLRRRDPIPGFDRISAWSVLAEIGTAMSGFEDAASICEHCK